MKDNNNGTVTIPIERYHNLYAIERVMNGVDMDKKVIVVSLGGYYETATYRIINPDDLEVKLKEKMESQKSENYVLKKQIEELEKKSKCWFESKQASGQIMDTRNWFQKLFKL